MRYLVIAANYRTSGIKDEFEGELCRNDIDLPDQLWRELNDWTSDYQEIIPMNPKQRLMAIEKIAELDKKGINLKQQVIDYFKGKAKVKYYSEGLLRYIL